MDSGRRAASPRSYYVLLGGSRNGERIVSDRELLELRLPSRGIPVWHSPRAVECYRPTRERRDGFTVARIVSTAPGAISTGYASTS